MFMDVSMCGHPLLLQCLHIPGCSVGRNHSGMDRTGRAPTASVLPNQAREADAPPHPTKPITTTKILK